MTKVLNVVLLLLVGQAYAQTTSVTDCSADVWGANCADPTHREFCDHDASILDEGFPRSICAPVSALPYLIGSGDYCGRCKPPQDLVIDVLYPSQAPSPGTTSMPTSSTIEITLSPVASAITSAPSNKQSLLPSAEPSSIPSSVPSGKPSGSSFPSYEPSSVPSSIPSGTPSGSALPSLEPSGIPSSIPSGKPSGSSLPSMEPSGVPSSIPSGTPSGSAFPSYEPSDTPSSVPSGIPSGSALPSFEPSGLPSSVPSGFPSGSALPSLEPSGTPSGSSLPSSEPSGKPSSEPSGMPSSNAILATLTPSTQTTLPPQAEYDTVQTFYELTFVSVEGELSPFQLSVLEDEVRDFLNIQWPYDDVRGTVVINVDVLSQEVNSTRRRRTLRRKLQESITLDMEITGVVAPNADSPYDFLGTITSIFEQDSLVLRNSLAAAGIFITVFE